MNLKEAVHVMCTAAHRDMSQQPDQTEIDAVTGTVEWLKGRSEEGKKLLDDNSKDVLFDAIHAMLHVAELNGHPDGSIIRVAAQNQGEQMAQLIASIFAIVMIEAGYKPLTDDIDVPDVFKNWASKNEGLL